jgi:endoglucanase
MNLPFLKALSEAAGVPGREERVRDILQREARGLFDDLSTDPMGNLIAIKRSKAPGAKRVLLACHMDEIGFYVRHVDDKGFVRVHNVGGFDTKNIAARRVLIQAADGDLVGLMNPSGRPIHIAKEEDKKKMPEITDFSVDLCLPADEVKKKVRIGDPVTLIQEFSEVGNCVSGKCLDNRVAAFVAVEAVKKLRDERKEPKYEVVLAATVRKKSAAAARGRRRTPPSRTSPSPSTPRSPSTRPASRRTSASPNRGTAAP